MEEKDYFEVFGLTPPEEAPDQAPEEQETGEGANEGDTAELPEDGTDEAEEAKEPDEEGVNEEEAADPPQESGKPTQTKEERARQAAARRKAEQDQAVQAALAAERERTDAEIKELFGWAGFKNGEAPIESLEDLRKYKADSDAARLEKDLKAGKLTPEALGQLVQAEIRRQQPAPAAQNEAFQAQVEAELAEIRKYAPEVRTAADFRKLDRAEEFFRQVREHGHSFAEAYRYVYADRIAEANAKRTAAAEVQRTRNNIRSKEHMRPAAAKGTGDVPVPADVMRMYRSIMPRASEEEIRRHYQKYAK